jgi:hypothetical protein
MSLNADVQLIYLIHFNVEICILNNDAGAQQFPPLIAPPNSVTRDSMFAPSPSPQSDGAGTLTPRTSVVPTTTGSLPGLPPANSPLASASSDACSLLNSLVTFPSALVLFLFVRFMMSMSL